jgi:hypothetical protein
VTDSFIRFDMDKVHRLREHYLDVLKFIKEDNPAVNINSPKSIKSFCKIALGLTLENTRIKTINDKLALFDSDSMEYCSLLGILYALKLKFAIANYLDCVIRHQRAGVLLLRIVDGKPVMSNRQPIFSSPEIWECVTECSPDVIIYNTGAAASKGV